MKQYVEAKEIPPSTADPETYIPEFIRLEVTTTVADTVAEIKTLLDPSKSYNIYQHDCYHDEGKACVITLLETV